MRPLLIFLLFGCLLTSCKQREYRVKMRDQGGVPQRVFSDNDPSRGELAKLQESYGHAPLQDSVRNETYFESSFEEALPAELEGVNGWSRLDGSFGDALFWFEQPTGSRYAWPELVRRVESGILWLKIMKLWAIEEFGTDRSEAIDLFFEQRVIPGVVDGYLRFVGAGSIMASQRVGFGLRKPEFNEELTPDEFFRLEVLIPIIIDLSRESKMTPEELHMGVLMGLDGASSQRERRTAWRAAGEEVALRFVRELDPERTSLSWSEIRSWGVSLLFFAAQPVKYRALMLESPVISDSEKATLRGGGVVFPPMPFGVKILGGGSAAKMTFELEPGAVPFLSNGRINSQDDEPLEVIYQMKLSPPDEGSLFGAPPAYAFWAVPKVDLQIRIFGGVELEAVDLAVATGWERLLDESAASRWQAAVEQSALEGSKDPMIEALKTIDLTPPASLRKLLDPEPAPSDLTEE
jgi:hypothetical protein